MKSMKKLFSMLVAVCLMVVLCIPAFAADSTFTISTKSDDTHTYSVYQIFTGDLSNGVLSNVKWGSNAKNGSDTVTAGDPVPDSVLTALTNVNNGTDQQKLAVIEQYADLTGTAYGTIAAGGKMENVPAGYYLIKDTTTNPTSGEEISEYVVAVVGDTVINPKRGGTTSDKKVDDKNDSNTSEDAVNWQDSADYDIGDTVPFKLSATITDEYANYSSYELIFHDEQSAGLTFNPSSVVVKVGETTIDSQYYTIKTKDTTDGYANPTDDCTFEIVFTDLKNVSAFTAGSTITVEYNSTLNTNAVIGSTGNPNESHITYSNNPNDTTSKGETPDDKVTVFTYKLTVNKTDGTNPLKGAGFTLYKKNAEGNYVAVGSEVKGTDMTTFTWTGLDDGDYKLSETTTPAGYNTAADIEFTITASHEITSNDPKLTSLSTNNTSVTAASTTTGEVTTYTGEISTTVVNNAGSTLPTTGGIGTTIFYVVGGIMAAGAAILLITKKRMGNDAE